MRPSWSTRDEGDEAVHTDGTDTTITTSPHERLALAFPNRNIYSISISMFTITIVSCNIYHSVTVATLLCPPPLPSPLTAQRVRRKREMKRGVRSQPEMQWTRMLPNPNRDSKVRCEEKHSIKGIPLHN